MCDSVKESDSNLPSGAAKQAVITNFCWDNFDILEETPSGLGTMHSTHGIIIQETSENSRTDNMIQDQTCNNMVMPVSKRRSANYQPTNLEPCFVHNKVEPTLVVNETYFEFGNEQHFKKAFFLWMFCRLKFNLNCPTLPGWKGWLSATVEDKEEKQTLVNYMPPINASVNELSTVQKLLQISMNVTRDLGQEFTFVTFDLAVAKKAFDIVWNQPKIYKNVIIHLGAFHTTMSYLSAIGKLMRGSGFEEIVIEAGICASGSLDSVLKGRHYNRAMRVHACMVEALERLLFTTFTQTCSNQLVTELSSEVKILETNVCHAIFDNAVSSENFNVLFAQYEFFKEEVKCGKYGSTAKFWFDYMEKVWNVLQFSVATKTNNFDMHVSSLQKLCPLLFCMNNHNYAKYLSLYYVMLLNLPEEAKCLIENRGFSVSRSDVPAGRCAIDMTIEQTINKDAKTRGGIVGFSRSLPTYYRWCVTRHNRSQYVSALQKITNMDSKSLDSHKDMTYSERQLSEKSVKSTVRAFSAFTNPLDVSTDALICLSSGKKVSEDVADDLLKVDKYGKEQFERFVNSRLKEKTVAFKHPLPKSGIKTFASAANVAVKSKTKEVKMKVQRNLFGQLLVLSHEHDIDMEKVLRYPLSPTPWSLASPDGLPLKTNKAQLLNTIEEQKFVVTEEISKMPGTVHVIDGMAFFHSLTNIPDTFGDLAKKVLHTLPQKVPVHFVTDRYQPDSIKSIERDRRGRTNDSFLLNGPAMKIPSNWNAFLASDANKKTLTNFLLSEIQKDHYAPDLLDREIFYVCEDRCEVITSEDGRSVVSRPIQDLFSSQEEADTRIILHCSYISNQEDVQNIIIKSPDTDVFLLLLSFADKINKTLIFDTGTKNKRRQINVSTLASSMSSNLREAILGLHAFTGSDTTSCFAGKGKVRPLKNLKKDQSLIDVFARLGTAQEVCTADQSKLEAFVCALYGKDKYSSVDKLRYDKVRQSFKGKKASFPAQMVLISRKCHHAIKFSNCT